MAGPVPLRGSLIWSRVPELWMFAMSTDIPIQADVPASPGEKQRAEWLAGVGTFGSPTLAGHARFSGRSRAGMRRSCHAWFPVTDCETTEYLVFEIT
jgi:hypothetical protein